MSLELRDYQIELSNQGLEILKKKGIVYFSLEVRTGKTLTALQTAKNYGAKKVIFTTKKKAIKGIQDDYTNFKFNDHFQMTVINNESLHTIQDNDFDLLISDEHHRCAAFPKPTKTAKDLRNRFGHLPIICLSGTPHPEAFTQVYHQFWVKKGFWKNHINFYKWFKDFGKPKKQHLGYAEVNIYTDLNERGIKMMEHLKRQLFITFTQKQAGFETEVNKKIIFTKNETELLEYCGILARNKFVEIEGHVIEADTAVKLQNKIHQISNGSVITDAGDVLILSYDKARFIKNHFAGKKLAMFYFYKAEWNILKDTFGDDLTGDLEEFNNTSKHIALQQVSGSEGISLKAADVLIYYNFGFSNVKFTQGIDRLTTMQRSSNDVYFIFPEHGINHRIYETIVYGKADYILSAFKKDFKVPYNYNKL